MGLPKFAPALDVSWRAVGRGDPAYRKKKDMRKTIVVLVATLGLGLGSTTVAAVQSNAAPLKAPYGWSVSNALPTKCPPAGAVGKPLALSVSNPKVVMYAAGLALECQYKSKLGTLTLSWSLETRTAFLKEEKTLGLKGVPGLGSGVSGYSMTTFSLAVQKGALMCNIEAYKVSLAHIEALAEVLLAHYW
jgi:hypothetical protein